MNTQWNRERFHNNMNDLALASEHVHGDIRENAIDGNLVLMYDHFQKIYVDELEGFRCPEELSSLVKSPAVHRGLNIAGNQLFGIQSKVTLQDYSDKLIKEPLEGYSSVVISNNVFSGAHNNVIGASVSIIGNEFLGGMLQSNVDLWVLADEGIFIGNRGAFDKSLIIHTCKEDRRSIVGNLIRMKQVHRTESN